MRKLALALAICAAVTGCRRKNRLTQGAEDARIETEQIEQLPRRLDLHGDPLPNGAIARLGSVRMLDRSLQHLVLSPDAKFAVSNAQDAYTVWDLATGRVERRIEIENAAAPMVMSPDGATIAGAVTGQGKVNLIGFGTGQIDATLEGHRGPVISLCFLGNDRLATGGKDGFVKIWNLGGEPEEQRALEGEWKEVTALACATRGDIIVWGTSDGGIYRHDAGGSESTVLELGVAKNAINAVALAPNGEYIVAGSSDDALRIWKSEAPATPVEVGAHDDTVYSLAFSPDSKRLYSSGGDAYFRAWNPDNGELVLDLAGVAKLSGQRMALSPDGKRIASWSKYTGGRGTEGGRWWLWDAETGDRLAEVERHSESVTSIAYSPDGTLLATGSEDHSVRLWDAITGKPEKVSEDMGGRVRAVRYSSDGKAVLASGEFAKLIEWRPSALSQTVKSAPIGGEVVSFDVSPDKTQLLTGDEIGRVWSVDLRSGQKIKKHDREAYSAITSVAFTRDGKQMIIAGRDKAILIIDAKTDADIAKLQPTEVVSNFAVIISPDGELMASAGDDHTIRLWSTNPWKEVQVLQGHDGTVRTVAFSSDGKRLASGSNDQTVRVWDLEDGEQLFAFEGHEGAVTAVAYAPDGKTIASAGQDTTGLIWTLPAQPED